MKLTVERHQAVVEAGLSPMFYKGRTPVYSTHQIDAVIEKKVAAEVAVTMKADSEYFTSAEFREDVMDELMNDGATYEQAFNRTRDQVRLFAEARTLNLM
jgi:2-methylisocitrate lyase-like PEP mutase family enzyme